MNRLNFACCALMACGRTDLDAPVTTLTPSAWAAGGAALASGASSLAMGGGGAGAGGFVSGGFASSRVLFTGGTAFGKPTHATGGQLDIGGAVTTGGAITTGDATGGRLTVGGAMTMGGATTTGGATTCDITVTAPSSIQSALEACPSPGTVCINSGLFRESLRLRDGVNVRGSGFGTRICGSIVADAATTLGVSLSQFSLSSRLTANGSVRLDLLELELNPRGTSDCPVAIDHEVTISRTTGSGIHLSAKRLKVGPWAFTITLGGSDVLVHDEISISQSRCTDPSQCWSFVELSLNSSVDPLPVGSRLDVELTNNLVPNIVLDGLSFSGTTALRPEDAAQSRVLVRHNTLVSKGDSNYAVHFGGPFGVPVTFANNVVAYIAHPIDNPGDVSVEFSADWVSNNPGSKAWFEDFDSGNFTPSENSPLLGTADPDYVVPIDIDGRPREGRYDVGAFQRQ